MTQAFEHKNFDFINCNFNFRYEFEAPEQEKNNAFVNNFKNKTTHFYKFINFTQISLYSILNYLVCPKDKSMANRLSETRFSADSKAITSFF